MREYKIGTAARLTGLEVATLRNWERRYRVVVARRNAGRQRVYSTEQIQRLRLLKRWVDAGLGAAEAHSRLREQLDRPTEPSGRSLEPGETAAAEVSPAHRGDIERARVAQSRSRALCHRAQLNQERASATWQRAAALTNDL